MEETIFFTNQEEGDRLFDKMTRLFNRMPANEFLAVVGYFRSSGYFKLRESFKDNKDVKLKILVGINVDKLTASYHEVINSASAQKDYADFVVDDIRHAAYRPDVEAGITQMLQDLKDGRLMIRIYKTKNIHAKFYVFLPDGFDQERGGHVIMGSSNLTDSGLGTTRPPQYEMNVDINRFGDVKFCKNEFEKLWEDGVELTAEDVADMVKKTYVGQAPTPYEIFIRVLIDKLGGQVEDGFHFAMPGKVKKFRYQTDAAIQGYQTILQHNGVILADVVGLGKTIIATMIVKRFMEANGKETKTLIVTPPAVYDNWTETCNLFDLKRNKHYQIVTNGSLHKVIDNERYNNEFWPKEDFDLVIVDEAHTFRTSETGRYDMLQQICKSRPSRKGRLNRDRKGVMLLSATPLNNKPEDMKNLLLLFQDSQASTIEGVTNLDNYFSEKIRAYKDIIKASKTQTGADFEELVRRSDELNEGIRADVLSKVTIRRTRTNILNNPDYRADLEKQDIKFPEIDPPREVKYEMDYDTRRRFFKTFEIFAKYDPEDEAEELNTGIINYGSHRPLEFLVPEVAADIFGGRKTNGKHIAQTLAAIYRTLMIKRLESSFFAFKESLKRFIESSENMLRMIDNDDVILNIRDEDDYQEPEDDGADDEAGNDGGQNGHARHFKAADFDPMFKRILSSDLKILRKLKEDWDDENDNPKWDCLKKMMGNEMFDPVKNPTGKLVIFSEFVDTLESLEKFFRDDLGRCDVLKVTSKERKALQSKIRANFDANLPEDQRKDDIKILLTSDALSEGINLHMANVIVNYDSPWNATRLMQRIGRVNRIGSQADHIVNYMFYPTDESEHNIALAARSVIKLQSFHSAFGEDSQIFSHEEVVRQFELFNKDVRDNVDKDLEMLRVLRALYADNRALYERIKALPAKSRTWRSRANRSDGDAVASRQTLVYVSNKGKNEFFQVLPGQKPKRLNFTDAIDILKADPAEPVAEHSDTHDHYAAVTAAVGAYRDAVRADELAALSLQKVNLAGNRDSRILGSAKKFLRGVKRLSGNDEAMSLCDRLTSLLESGTFSQMDNDIDKLRKRLGRDDEAIVANMGAIVPKLAELCEKAGSAAVPRATEADAPSASAPAELEVIISESYVD